jgi:cholesterol oxidase
LNNQSFDYIIIGSGFGGSVAALRLAEKGYSVMVLEKGKRYSASDFPKTNWNLRKYLWIPGVGVGGGSLVYANTLFYPPDDFFEHASWNRFRDWKQTLDPYYQKAGKMMGRTKYNNLNVEDRVLREIAVDFGREESFDMVHVGVYLGDTEKETDPYFNGEGPKRKGCIECGGCMVGCRENAKNSLDKNYLFFAQKKGAELLAETKAYKVEYREDHYYVYTKPLIRSSASAKTVFRSRGIILAGGTLGTLKLLLQNKYQYKTLQRISDCLGDKVLTNSETLCAVSGIRQKMNNGLAITSVFNPDDSTHIEIVKYPDGSNSLKWFFSLSASGSRLIFFRIVKLLWKTITHPVAFLKTFFNGKWSTGLIIFLVMQHIENYMQFRWKRGIFGRRLKIINSGRLKAPAYIDIGQKVMECYADKTSGVAQNIILEILFNRPTTAHILGGCPMSENSKEGVIDDHFRVHGYPGIYVVDGSAMQGNPGVNPSFSILAMAEYAMDHIPSKNQKRNKLS